MSQPSKKVLIVEDEAIVRFDISEHLSQHGFSVLEAADSAEAFDHLEAQPDIAFLITDIDMPGMLDGLILAKFAAERWPHVGVLVISGKRRAEVTDIPDGAVFVAKPFELASISQTMLTWGASEPAS